MNTHKCFGNQTNASISRRLFLRRTGTAGLGFWIIPRHVMGQGQIPPSEKLDIAGIGIGGQGGAVLRDPAISSQNIVALCDVDWKYAAGTVKVIGDKGTMVCGGWSGAPRLFPAKRQSEFQLPAKTIPRSPGHRAEWVQACKARRPEDAKAGFAYSGPFTEALLVGNLATRLQQRVEWDAAKMQAKNAPEADILIRKHYRDGFGI